MAADIDPTYAQTLNMAIAQGVEVLAWQADLSEHSISLIRPLKMIV